MRRLLGYLFTEGLAGEHGLESEHRNAHVVAGYEPPDLLEPTRDGQGRPQLARLAALLDAPLKAGGVGPDAKPVYHLAISAAPGDRLLTDAEWADIAGQYVRRLGLAPEGEPDGCGGWRCGTPTLTCTSSRRWSGRRPAGVPTP